MRSSQIDKVRPGAARAPLLLAALILAGSLAGCVAYPAYPAYPGYAYGYGANYGYAPGPVVVGGWGWGGGYGWHGHDGGWHHRW